MSLVPTYLRDPHAVLFVFDLSSTFAKTKSGSRWLQSRSGWDCFGSTRVDRRFAFSAATSQISPSTGPLKQAGRQGGSRRPGQQVQDDVLHSLSQNRGQHPRNVQYNTGPPGQETLRKRAHGPREPERGGAGVGEPAHRGQTGKRDCQGGTWEGEGVGVCLLSDLLMVFRVDQSLKKVISVVLSLFLSMFLVRSDSRSASSPSTTNY